jgi:hypothetical protein
MTITVGNLRRSTEGVICDRRSILGNPFEMRVESERMAVILAFRLYLNAVDRKGRDPVGSAKSIAYSECLDLSDKWQRPNRPTMIAELDRVARLAADGDITLLCWCNPLPCHCDVLKSYFEWVIS